VPGPGDDEYDPALLLAVIRSSPDMVELLRWAAVAQELEQNGALTYPLRELADLDPLFEARPGGLSQKDVDRFRRTIPEEAFPVPDFDEFLRKTLVIIDLVHTLPDPDEFPRKMRGAGPG
jgi:hypothetical protein